MRLGADACVRVTPQCGRRHTDQIDDGRVAAKVAVTLDESRDLFAAVYYALLSAD